MSRVTKDSTLNEINNIPELHWFDTLAGDAEQDPQIAQMNQMSLEQLGAFGNWNVESICSGYNRLIDIARSGHQIFYPLFDENEVEENPAVQERYIVHFAIDKKAPFVIVAAGGGYAGCASMIEGYPTCKQLNELGYHAFELNYRCGANAQAPNPIEDMAIAVNYIMEHAEELNVDPSQYAVCGFSAGGHLAGCFASETIGYGKYSLPKPGAAFLAYPVVTFGEEAHEMSRALFLGKEADNEELRTLYSVEKQVTENYAPTFLWQCERDNTVSIGNSQMLNSALELNNIPHAYEIFDSDAHGWGAGENTLADGWVRRATAFWEKNRSV